MAIRVEWGIHMDRIPTIICHRPCAVYLPLQVSDWLREVNDHLLIDASAAGVSAFSETRPVIHVPRKAATASHMIRAEIHNNVCRRINAPFVTAKCVVGADGASSSYAT